MAFFRPICSCKRVNTTIYNCEVAITCLVKILNWKLKLKLEGGGGRGKSPKTPH